MRGGGFLRISVLENVAGLALQYFANGFQRTEADGFGLAGFKDRKVGKGNAHLFRQLIERHFALGHHHV